MRHGQSEANIHKRIASSPDVCIDSCGLTEEGRRQALSSAENFAALNRADLIISSDFKRARETAQILAETANADLELSPMLRERFFGIYDGGDDSNYQKVWELDAKGYGYQERMIESPEAIAERIRKLILSLELHYADKNIVLVTHGDVIQIGLCIFAQISPFEHRSITQIHTAEIRPAASKKQHR
jgi:probable phosphoglycerate mutase